MSRITRRSVLKASAATLGLSALGLAGAGSLTGCSTSANGSRTGSSAAMHYRYQFLGNANMKDAPVVAAAVSKYLKEHGLNVSLDFAPNQDYDKAMTLAISAGNAGDFYFTAPWINNYQRNAGQGALLELDELLPKYAPKLWASMPSGTWDAARVKGKIYGVINQQRFPRLWGVYGQQKIVDKYKVHWDQVTSFYDMEPYLARVKQGEPNLIPWYTSQSGNGGLFYPEMYGWDPIGTAWGLGIKYDDEAMQVFNMFDTAEFRKAASTIRAWRTKGYLASQPPTDADGSVQLTSGKEAFNVGQVAPDGSQPFTYKISGKCLVDQPILTSDSITATLTGVNSAAKNPEQIMRYLELVNTDKDLYNLICFGIKGRHWVWKDKSINLVGFPKGVDASNARWNPNEDWVFGNQFNAYYRTEIDAKQKTWELDRKVNESAKASVANGFNFDTTPVQNQIATLSAAVGQYKSQAMIGLQPYPQGVSKLLKAMDDAGLKAVQAEMQNQIDAFKKSK